MDSSKLEERNGALNLLSVGRGIRTKKKRENKTPPTVISKNVLKNLKTKKKKERERERIKKKTQRISEISTSCYEEKQKPNILKKIYLYIFFLEI